MGDFPGDALAGRRVIKEGGNGADRFLREIRDMHCAKTSDQCRRQKA
jgi:hypothetical protein